MLLVFCPPSFLKGAELLEGSYQLIFFALVASYAHFNIYSKVRVTEMLVTMTDMFSLYWYLIANYVCFHLEVDKIKLRSLMSSEHINEKGDGPYRGFGYLSLVGDPIGLATWNQR